MTPVLPGEQIHGSALFKHPTMTWLGSGRNAWAKYKESLNAQFGVSRAKNQLSIIDRLVYLPWEIITYPDPMRGWYKHAVQAGDKLLQSEQIDAILSSSYPVTCHLIAKTLAEKYQIPWIADLRDLWTQNPYSNHCAPRRLAERNLELRHLASECTATVSSLWQALSRLHAQTGMLSPWI